MANQIKGNDIIQDNHLDNAIKSGEQLLKVYKELDAQIKKTAKATKAGLGGTSSAKGIKQLNQALTESQLKKKAALKIDKDVIKAEQELKVLRSDKIQRLTQLKVLQQEQRKINKDLAKETNNLTNAYEKESIRLNKLRKELKNLILTEGESSKKTKQLAAEVQKLDAKLKKADAAAGQFQRNVGNYKSGLKGAIGSVKKLAMAFGLFGGIQLVVKGIRNMFNVVKNFDQATADLASILGVTTDEMAELTQQAMDLGAATIFTAAQVSELQKEYAKLGFTQEEIKGVTEATLELAAATNSDLGQSATVVGSTLRAFGLDVSQTQRVVDVMAKSFSSSSLDMEKFTTAMRSVAPVAKNAGFNIEQTTSLLGTLTDAGIDASTAGTGLRNVFLELSKRGMTFEEAMSEINNATDKNAASLALFGKRGAVVGTVLAENGVSADALTEKLNNAGGAAKEMADKQLNTLGGAVKLLQSAWEGWILKMNESSGFGAGLTKIVKFLAENLDTLLTVVGRGIEVFAAYKAGIKAAAIANKLFSKSGKDMLKGWGGPLLAMLTLIIIGVKEVVAWLNELSAGQAAIARATEKANEKLDDEKIKLESVGAQLNKTNAGTKERDDLLKKINAEYGTTLKNLEDEAAFLKQLEMAYKSVTAEIEKKALIQALNEELVNAQKAVKKFERDLESGAVTSVGSETIMAGFKQTVKDIAAEIAEIRAQDNGFKDKKTGAEELADRFGQAKDEIKGTTGAIKELRKEVSDFDEDDPLGDLDLDFDGVDYSRKVFIVPEYDSDEAAKAAKKAIDDQEKLDQKRLQQQKDFAQKSLNITKALIDSRIAEIDREVNAKKEEIDVSNNEISRLQALGTAEANEALKAEKVKQAKDKIAIEQLEKKKKNLLITITTLELANSFIQQGDGKGLTRASNKMSAFLDKLPTFYEGTTGTVAQALGATGTKDGHTVRVHDNEHIISAKHSDELHAAGLTKNSDIVASALAYQNDRVNSKALKGRSVLSDSRIVSRLDRVEQAINNFEPVKVVQQHIDLATGREVVIDGNKITKNNHNPSSFKI